MPHPSKKQRLNVMESDLAEATADREQMMVVTSADLSVDVLPNILGYLDVQDIMNARVCKKWTEAATKTTVPPTDFRVNSMRKYNAMNVMTRAMPNLQQITLSDLGGGHKYSNGEDPDDELAAFTADYTAHDIEIISNFSKLRILKFFSASLNGRYPFLFSSFPLLQKLSIKYCNYIKWDLDMLSGFPLLKELDCLNNICLTGNINSLRVLKGTLQKVSIRNCKNIEGNFMDLADFLHLKELDVDDTAVTGDIRDIRENDFSSLEQLELPPGVYGGRGYELQSISDGLDLIRTLYLFNKQRPNVIEELHGIYWILSGDSPDRYESAVEDGDSPPFYIGFVEAGSRVGYRWETANDSPCEMNWLDPEPDRESSDYGKYIKELEQINSRVGLFRGFYQPPTEEEYNRLWEEHTMD